MESTTYGATITVPELNKLMQHVLQPGQPSDVLVTPLCIWGKPGIGKTEIVRAFTRKLGWSFQQINPAQFEEMGDLLGMPIVQEDQTVFRPPSWVPRSNGPGILLIDDVNRADDRILRGIMQLLQDGRLISWTLPPQWQIVLTANPDTGDFSVTPLDAAMLTRMLHVELVFELSAWLRWAGAAGLDLRGLDFAARYPELMVGTRTNPRSMTQFLIQAGAISDWRRSRELVLQLAAASLDSETVGGLMQYIQTGGSSLPDPSELLINGPGQQAESYSPAQFWVVTERLLRFLGNDAPALTNTMQGNLKVLLLSDGMPEDMRLGVAQRLTALNRKDVQAVLADQEVAMKLV